MFICPSARAHCRAYVLHTLTNNTDILCVYAHAHMFACVYVRAQWGACIPYTRTIGQTLPGVLYTLAFMFAWLVDPSRDNQVHTRASNQATVHDEHTYSHCGTFIYILCPLVRVCFAYSGTHERSRSSRCTRGSTTQANTNHNNNKKRNKYKSTVIIPCIRTHTRTARNMESLYSADAAPNCTRDERVKGSVQHSNGVE